MTLKDRAIIALLNKPKDSLHVEPCEHYEEAITIYGVLRREHPFNRIIITTPMTHGTWGVGIYRD